MSVLGATSTIFEGMAQGIRTLGAVALALPFRIHFIALWIFGIFFLFFNASDIYGADATRWQMMLLFYMAALAFFHAETQQPNPLSFMTAGEFLGVFLFWSAVGWFGLKAFAPLVPTEAVVLTSASIGILLAHALVVAIGEELLFRHGFPAILPGPMIARMTMSAMGFAVLHWSAYGGSIENLLFAFLLGLLFGVITLRARNGLVIAMALHFSYNAFVLGYNA